MTLEEKVGQLQQLDGDAERVAGPRRASGPHPDGAWSARSSTSAGRGTSTRSSTSPSSESRLKIPLLFGFDVIHGYRTIFPIPLGEASSWDPAAVERSARIAAAEASAAGAEVGLRPDGGHRPRPAMGADRRGLGRGSLPGIGHGPGPGPRVPGRRPGRPGSGPGLRQALGRLRRGGGGPRLQRRGPLGADPAHRLLPAVPGGARGGGGDRS